MKVTTVSLALCAALALATDMTPSVAAKGSICATGSGFADTPASTTSATPSGTTGTDGVTTTAPDAEDASSSAVDAEDAKDSADDAETTGSEDEEASSEAEASSEDDSADADTDVVQNAASAAKNEATGGSSSGSSDEAASSSTSGQTVGSETDADTDSDSGSDSGTETETETETETDSESASCSGSSSSSSGSPTSPSSSSSTTSSSSGSFTKVTALQARVQGDIPTWNDEYGRFVSAYYDTFEEKYQAVLDTVNMAAVEGALKYVQAECINASVVEDCARKNSIKYVVFYETTIVQPTAAMEYYANATDASVFAMEHCPFMAMDGGQCDPNEDGSFPDVCNQYIGADGQPDLGFCIGGTLQDSEVLAPYPNNYWFSFPNSCPQELWDDKTASCREEYAGGMCALGVEPDGETCSYSYEVLGYILLDDVVGITSLINPLTLDYFADYYEFCEAGGIEFSATVLGDLVSLVEGLAFWANPGSSEANAERAEKLVAAYQALVAENATTADGGLMQALPTVEALTALNPPCYENIPMCAEAEFGCKRALYSQICELCVSEDDDCVVKP